LFLIFYIHLDKFAFHKFFTLEASILYISVSFVVGFLAAWSIRTITIIKNNKIIKSNSGLLETERLVKETLRKESAMAFQQKETIEAEMTKKLKEAADVMKMMDNDILLLQKSNEENEALFKAAEPELFQIKMKLIEANNTIARLKSQLSQPKSTNA
jgi:hypothetical protein